MADIIVDKDAAQLLIIWSEMRYLRDTSLKPSTYALILFLYATRSH
jgi:hypothetical protein